MQKSKNQIGRKQTFPELKEQRHYTLTKTAHDQVLTIANILGFKYRSELIEAIGCGQAIVSLPKPADILAQEIPIYHRLTAILKEPVSRFRGTLYMARILAYQLGITEDKKDFYKSEKAIIDAVRDAFSILALEDFLHPEQYLLDVTSAMQYLVFKILIGKAGLEEQSPSPDIKKEFLPFYNEQNFQDQNIDVPIKLIFNAIAQLKVNYPQHYQALHMRMMQGLSFSKICSLLRIRNADLSKDDTFCLVREAIQALRLSWHSQRAAGIESILYPVDPSLLESMKPLMTQAQTFYTLTRHDKINGDTHEQRQARKDWELFLIKAMIKPDLALWVGEVCHARGHEFDKPSQTNSKKCNQYQQATIEAISDGLEEEVRPHLETLKNRLRFRGIENQALNDTLLETINEIGRIKLMPEYFSEKRKRLQDLCLYSPIMKEKDETSNFEEIRDTPLMIYNSSPENMN